MFACSRPSKGTHTSKQDSFYATRQQYRADGCYIQHRKAAQHSRAWTQGLVPRLALLHVCALVLCIDSHVASWKMTPTV
jgi:hypothetical protein